MSSFNWLVIVMEILDFNVRWNLISHITSIILSVDRAEILFVSNT
jgi:hypothetical protein